MRKRLRKPRQAQVLAPGLLIILFLAMAGRGVAPPEHDSGPEAQERHRSFSALPDAEQARVPLHDWEVDYRFKKDDGKSSALGSRRIFGGIVPHHLLAQSFIAEMFSLLASQENPPRTVVVVSPNHAEKGSEFVQTSTLVWETSEGPVPVDREKVGELSGRLGIPVRNDNFREEHGIYNILPYLRHFLPEAKVVAITVRFAAPEDQRNELASVLGEWMNQEDTVVVASIDFSHYLPAAEAMQKDQETLRSLRSFDYPAIAQYRSDHLDSPGGLAILLKAMEAVGATDIAELGYDNSGEALGQRFVPTTSHFLIAFTKSQRQ
jgi:AmmeMemoRadiSam system protein B